MQSVSTYLDRLVRYMENRPEGQWIEIGEITKDKNRFIIAIKYLIDYETKNYEFSSDYTRVRRFGIEIDRPKQAKETESPAASEQLSKAPDDKDQEEPEEGPEDLG